MPAVAVHGLTKRFGEKVAVDLIDLSVPAGTFYGICGPNGAGKTTLLGLVSGLLRPDAGLSTTGPPTRAGRASTRRGRAFVDMHPHPCPPRPLGHA